MGSLESDIHKVAERKRMEADRVRFELNKALKELYELQSACMALEREVDIVNTQLPPAARAESSKPEVVRKPGTAAPVLTAVSRRPVTSASPPKTAPMGSSAHSSGPSPPRAGSLMEAIYGTDAIKAMVVELDAIHADTETAAYHGRVYEHMRRRLAEEVVEARRQARELQDKVAAERTRNNDVHRRELEAGRQLGVAQGRLVQMRKDVDAQGGHWRTEVKDRRAFVTKRKEFVAYLENQIASARRGSRVVIQLAAPPPTTETHPDGTRNNSFDADAKTLPALLTATWNSNQDKKRTAAAALLTSRSLARRLSRSVAAIEQEESRYIVALRTLGLKVPDIPEPADAPPNVSRPPSAALPALGTARSRNSHTPASARSSASHRVTSMLKWPSKSSVDGSTHGFDALFVLKACVQQDEVRRQLLDKLQSEEARIAVLARRLADLHAPVRPASAARGHGAADAQAHIASPMRLESARSSAQFGEGLASRDDSRMETTRMPLPSAERDADGNDDVPGVRPTNRELATKEALLSDVEKKLQLIQSQHDFLMSSVTPVRVGLAGMARKLLDGASVTLADPAEAHAVLTRLGAKCAAMVDEIRKVVAMNDPESGGVDWAALQAEEGARSRLRKGGALGAVLAEESTEGDPSKDDDEGDGDEDAEVINRGELKKMSQKLVKYRRKLDRQVIAADAAKFAGPEATMPQPRGASRGGAAPSSASGPRSSLANEMATTARTAGEGVTAR